MVVFVVLSGGSGKRLWPLSRSGFPKQFLRLYKNQSLFGLALDRLDISGARFLVVCNDAHYFHALEEITKAKLENRTQFLLESVPKNTMSALILASLACAPEEVIVTSPTDHLMDKVAFQTALQLAIKHAQEGKIMLFGVAQEPSSLYGFMECSQIQEGIGKILSFVEKPSAQEIGQRIARSEHGDFYINSGMFVFKSGVFLQACKEHVPEMLQACTEVYRQAKRLPHIIKCGDMQHLQEGSVDVLLWQKCQNLFLVPLEAQWQDVGHFASLKQSLKADIQNNTYHTSPLDRPEYGLKARDATNNYVYNADGKFTGLLGVHDLVVVDTKDCLLVAKNDYLDHLKDFVEEVSQMYPQLLSTYPLEYRPWGSFEVLLDRPSFKVKLLEITPKKRLSLQRHQYRSEHWVVVEGVASVVVGTQSIEVKANESVFIQQGQIHRLGNDTDRPLKILEVQCGTRLEESDIERLEDDYKRP